MAKNENKERGSKSYMDRFNEDGNEEEHDIEAVDYKSESDNEDNRRTHPHSPNSSQIWPQTYRYNAL